MSQDHYNEFIGPKSVLLSGVLTLAFWATFTWLLIPFVPAEAPALQLGFAGFTAACISGVFFIASQMFMLVLAEQRKAKRA